jgi:LuxR family maltose regulon positive regulatory protein
MATPLMSTKVYLPPPRPQLVHRMRLLERLRAGLDRRLTLLSAPAGFGKTTLLSAWLASAPCPVAWLSLDPGDADPARFFLYLLTALQTIQPAVGSRLVAVLQSPQPPPLPAVLPALLNDLATLPAPLLLVLDDYHTVAAPAVDAALTLLLEHLPPALHLVLATREDPALPLARLRARDQLVELRAADLRFTAEEAAIFLIQVMGLELSEAECAALERRTEGWIAGLQLAALSLQGQPDAGEFVRAFTGSHHFVLDYLVQEVLQQQPQEMQRFLLQTAILPRLCGPLCEAVLEEERGQGQATLEALERANLFVVPLDDERRWYRYHHLFAELLRQRLQTWAATDPEVDVAALHRRASRWYEEQGFLLEAFQHATAAGDIEHAERLMEGRGIPLHFRGAVGILLEWLGSLPPAVLNTRPSLWVRYASLLLVNGHTTGVDEKLNAAEAALAGPEPDAPTRNLLGQIAAARATLGLTRYQVDTMLTQSRRALELLDSENRPLRANAYWTMGFAYFLQSDLAACTAALDQAISLAHAAGDIFTTILASISIGNVQEAKNQLYTAAETYRKVLELAGDQPVQVVYEAHLGLGRINYAWNDLEAAEQYGRQSLLLARQYESVIDRFIVCEVFLARMQLAHGDLAGAAARLDQAEAEARAHQFVLRLPDVASLQVEILLRQGQRAAAAQLAQTYALPLCRARVQLAEGDPEAALAVLEPWGERVVEQGWVDEALRVRVLQALAEQARGEREAAVRCVEEAVALAEPGGCIRLFVDEGEPMQALLEHAAGGRLAGSIQKLLAAFAQEQARREASSQTVKDEQETLPAQPLLEPLSRREMEVLRLIAQGLSNQEIGERLFVALDTVKGHNQKIFAKLQVQRRTEAVARARELGIII